MFPDYQFGPPDESVAYGWFYSRPWPADNAATPQDMYLQLDTGTSQPPVAAVDGLGIDSLAAMFTSVGGVCEALTTLPSPPGTHLEESSVTDQQLACEAAARDGATLKDALTAIAAAGGGTAVLWWLAHQGAVTQPGFVPTPGIDLSDDPEPTTAPTTYPLARLTDELITLNPTAVLSVPQAKATAKTCLWQASRLGLNGETECTRLPLFVSGSEVSEAALHDIHALRLQPQWLQLNREQSSTKSGSGWQSSQPECQDNPDPALQACDEYPFFGTEQGGPLAVPRPDLRLIDRAQNSLQGTRYSSFISACKMKTGMGGDSPISMSVRGDRFLAIPLPPQAGIPYVPPLCNGKDW
jgi:hypothetical protein